MAGYRSRPLSERMAPMSQLDWSSIGNLLDGADKMASVASAFLAAIALLISTKQKRPTEVRSSGTGQSLEELPLMSRLTWNFVDMVALVAFPVGGASTAKLLLEGVLQKPVPAFIVVDVGYMIFVLAILCLSSRSIWREEWFDPFLIIVGVTGVILFPSALVSLIFWLIDMVGGPSVWIPIQIAVGIVGAIGTLLIFVVYGVSRRMIDRWKRTFGF